MLSEHTVKAYPSPRSGAWRTYRSLVPIWGVDHVSVARRSWNAGIFFVLIQRPTWPITGDQP